MRKSEKRCQGIQEWPSPQCKRDLQRFLGLVNYYRRYIPRLSELATPLHPLTGNIEWTWDNTKEAAFSAVKKAFFESYETAIPTDHGAWKLETDASKIAIGAILSQQQDDGTWKMVDCLSKSLSSAEKNYDTHDREMLAIIRALEEWQHFLVGTPTTFDIWTDHLNLGYFWKLQPLNGRQNRWANFLTMFNFVIRYRPGRTNEAADALSRRPDHGETILEENVVLLPPEMFAPIITQTLDERIREAQHATPHSSHVIEEIDGSCTYRGRIWILSPMVNEILRLHHDAPSAGHPGI
jgi:hypothetical protein